MTSGKDSQTNLKQIQKLLDESDLTAVDIVVIPEMFAQFGVAQKLR